MIKKLLIILLAACFALCLFGCKDGGPAEEITRGEGIFTEFTAEDFDGNKVDSSVFKGCNVTMINVWATWCKPCRDELPALGELHGQYGGKGFQVIGIAYDAADLNYNKKQSAYAAALKIVEDTGAGYRHLIPSKSMKEFLDGIKSVHVTVFVDGDGYQLGKAYVGTKSKKEWKKIIDNMLEFASGES